ncbi:hypothetical protein HYV12_01550 [Candidatus Dojkabacteria bacterium]|nr:hypothetical protein [Candidatus Dojkabacteria bacterium]
MQDTPVVNNLETKSAALENAGWIRTLPTELVGLIPDSVWSTLSLDQKKEILRQNGILEKYNSNQPTAEQPVESLDELPSLEVSSEVSSAPLVDAPKVEEQVNASKESEEFATLVETVKENEIKLTESGVEDGNKLSAEEKSRVEEENATTANTQTFKLFGYQVDDALTNDASNISEQGDINDGRTWAATLIKKIFAIFGE